MKVASYLASSLLLLTAHLSHARRHHDALAARHENVTELETRGLQTNEFQIYKPGDTWGFKELAIATSYIPDNNTPMTGACGWNVGSNPLNRHKSKGGLIYGAAQMYSVFGNGVSCGTCLRLNATERDKYGDVGSFRVSVINSCPPPCQSLDLEVPGIVKWLKRDRVGQLNIHGEVVPCNFKENGIYIEIYQYTTTIYDVRFGIRANSGSVKLAEIACAGTKNFLPLKKENPMQYTLANGNQNSPAILKCKFFDFRVTNFAISPETILLEKVPNKLYQGKPDEWHNTGTNFETT